MASSFERRMGAGIVRVAFGEAAGALLPVSLTPVARYRALVRRLAIIGGRLKPKALDLRVR
jgi:hypothetical protein